MAALVDVHRPCARQLVLLFFARLAAAVPDQVARLFDSRDDLPRDARLRRAGRLRAWFRLLFRLVDALGPFRGKVPALDDDRDAGAGGGGDPWSSLRAQRPVRW